MAVFGGDLRLMYVQERRLSRRPARQSKLLRSNRHSRQRVVGNLKTEEIVSMFIQRMWNMRIVLAVTTLIIAVFGVGSRAIRTAALCAPSCQAGSDKKWQVKIVAGSKKSNVSTKSELMITDQSARFKKGKETALEIPAAGISEVGYDNSSHNRGWAYLKAISGPGSGGGIGSGIGGVVYAPILAPAAILAPFKSTQNFVRILWDNNGNPSEIILEVEKQDYHAVLDELQRLSGKPWVDLPQARKKLVSEIAQAKDRSVPLEIDRNIVLYEAEMKPGRYQAVFLERPGNHGEVYFFSGTDVNPERISAQAVVNVETLNSETTNPGVTYVVEQGVETINAIQLSGKKLVFASGALPARVAKSLRSFYGGGDKWATVIQTDYEGEPALRFNVIHNPFPHVCQEYIYVTRARVVSVIGPNSPQSGCGTFSVDRNEIKASAQEAKRTNRFLKVTVQGKNYIFQPIFEQASGNGRIAMLGKSRDAARDYAEFFVQAVTDFDSVMAKGQAESKSKP